MGIKNVRSFSPPHTKQRGAIIFLYLKRRRGEPLFAKTYGATTLGIDGRIIDVEEHELFLDYQIPHFYGEMAM